MSGLSAETLILGQWPGWWRDALQDVMFFAKRVAEFLPNREAVRLADLEKESHLHVKDYKD